jgi:uncharacterized cofD-like protein
VALAEADSLLAAAFEHRFDADELTGHALGNLVIAGLMAARGDPQEGLDETARLLGAVGRVVPAATEPVVLKAEAADGEIEGQTAVMATPHIRRVSLVPSDPPAPPAALAALADADQVVIGPGSLFTSVLAAAAVPGIADGLRRSPGRKVYVANLHPQAAETAGYDVAAHVAALAAHGVPVDVVLADPASITIGDVGRHAKVIEASLAKSNGRAHDPAKLASVLVGLVG